MRAVVLSEYGEPLAVAERPEPGPAPHGVVDSLAGDGVCVQVGLTDDEDRGEKPLPMDAIAQDGLSFHGSRWMAATRYDELIEGGHVDPEALVTDIVSLADAPDRPAAMSDFGIDGVEVVTES